MAADLLSIARSGVKTARSALDVTAQNIANASSEGYVRRSILLEEVAASGGIGRVGDISYSGVRVERVVRSADLFRQAEVRRTGSDAARAQAEVSGLEKVETAVDKTGIFPAIVKFEGALQQLAFDPVNPALRASLIDQARGMTGSFNIAATSLDATGEDLRFEASNSIEQVNLLSSELARVNSRLVRAADASSDQTVLLDQRDNLLQKLSQHVDISTSIAADKTVSVRIGGAAGPQLVTGADSGTLTMATAGDGTISFTLDGNAVTPVSGSLAGIGQSLVKLRDVRADLDTIASSIISTVNTVQTGGAALDGSAGQPLLTGTGAADMGLAFQSGALIATAPAGAGANSRDPANLTALRSALESADPAGRMDGLLFDISGTVAGRRLTRDALNSIAGNAQLALQAQAGVDLDQEAVNLIRYQQAFQASGRVMQVASDLFNTLLSVR